MVRRLSNLLQCGTFRLSEKDVLWTWEYVGISVFSISSTNVHVKHWTE